jgi:hypothetical protein
MADGPAADIRMQKTRSTGKNNEQTTQQHRIEHHLRHNAILQQDSGSTSSTVSRAWQLSTPYFPITYYITSKYV